MIAESLLGGVFGGLLRLAPEVLKFFDRKDERRHELAMMDKEFAIAQLKAEQAMRVTEAAIDTARLTAIGTALEGQAAMSRDAGWFMSAVSASVRPVVTYWFMALYSLMKIALLTLAWGQGLSWQQVFITTWSEQDWAIFAMLMTFWFVGRVQERR